MNNRKAKFKRGDILYCHRLGILACECVVQVLSRMEEALNSSDGPGYHVRPVSPGACKIIHDNCCAEDATKVPKKFVKYLMLFKQ